MVNNVCSVCGGQQNVFGPHIAFITIKNHVYCGNCIKDIYVEISKIPVTTTPSMDGYVVKKYLGIESVEIVIGTGPFSEFVGDIADLFGERATPFERKMQDAKNVAIQQLKRKAYEIDANAVIGIDLDYTEFTGNRIGVIANGTLVQIEPIQSNYE